MKIVDRFDVFEGKQGVGKGVGGGANGTLVSGTSVQYSRNSLCNNPKCQTQVVAYESLHHIE